MTDTNMAVRLTGTNTEIKLCLVTLLDKGFSWDSNGKFYPQRNELGKFAYYLNNFQCDAVLSGANKELE